MMKYEPYKEYKARIKTLEQLKSEFKVDYSPGGEPKIYHSTGRGGGLHYRNIQLTNFFGQIVTIKFHRETSSKEARNIFHWRNDRHPLYEEWCEWIEDPETLLKIESDFLPKELFEI